MDASPARRRPGPPAANRSPLQLLFASAVVAGVLVALLSPSIRADKASEAPEGGGGGIDGDYRNVTLTRLAFGSCNKQVNVAPT